MNVWFERLMVINVKKLFAAGAAISAFAFQVGYAFGITGDTSSLSQLEIIDYVALAGVIIFVLGLLLVIISVYMRVKTKEPDEDDLYLEEDREDINSEDDDSDDGIIDDEAVSDYNEDDSEADISDNVDDTNSVDGSNDSEDSEDSEDVEHGDDSESGEGENSSSEENLEPESDSEGDRGAVTEIENQSEDDNPAEEESKSQKVRVSFTGQNNSDVKFVEFSNSATVGRRSSNDLIIPDNAVSGMHCELTFDDGKVYIEDLNSTNGTFIDGERISRAELKNGDILIIGKMSFKVNISVID